MRVTIKGHFIISMQMLTVLVLCFQPIHHFVHQKLLLYHIVHVIHEANKIHIRCNSLFFSSWNWRFVFSAVDLYSLVSLNYDENLLNVQKKPGSPASRRFKWMKLVLCMSKRSINEIYIYTIHTSCRASFVRPFVRKCCAVDAKINNWFNEVTVSGGEKPEMRNACDDTGTNCNSHSWPHICKSENTTAAMAVAAVAVAKNDQHQLPNMMHVL